MGILALGVMIMSLPFGIDISSYQGAPDFVLLNNQVDFIAIRAGISWGFTDPPQ